MNGTNGNEPGYPENALVPYPVIVAATKGDPDAMKIVLQEQFVTEAVEKTMPISLSCSLLISVVCSLLFSKAIADPIKKISTSTERMMKLDHGANCPIHTNPFRSIWIKTA